MQTENSTIGRSLSFRTRVAADEEALRSRAPEKKRSSWLGPETLKWGLRGLDTVSPELTARVAEHLWFKPPRRALSSADRARLERGRPLSIEHDGRKVSSFVFGAGRPVLLMHGWGGNAAQLLELVDPLVGAGFSAVTVEALGHGLSDTSRLGLGESSFVDFAGSMRAASRAVGPLAGVVAHSGGAVATGLALAGGLEVDRLVLIAPMARPQRYTGGFQRMLGLSDDVMRRFRENSAKRIGFAWDALDLTTARERSPIPPTLVVHDELDKEVSIAEGRAVAEHFVGSTFIATSGLGHQRILKEPAVIDRAVAFFAQGGS